MPATKIINVSKSDEFEEVFDLFKRADAEEVIFIFPKGSRFIKQEQYFEAIKKEADSSGKQVSIMTADPIIGRFASKYGFETLGEKGSRAGERETVPQTIPQAGPPSEAFEAEAFETEAFEEELKEEFEELPPYDTGEPYYTAEPDESLKPAFARAEAEFSTPVRSETVKEEELLKEEPEAILAAAIGKESGGIGEGRMIKDILPSGADRRLKIKEERERSFEVNVKSRIDRSRDRGADIEKIWAEEGKWKKQPNFLANINPLKKIKSRRFLGRLPLFLTLGAILTLALVLYATLGNARIVIYPRKQKLDFKMKVSASSAITTVNFDFNQVPGQRFREQKEESGTFVATGQKDVVQKASGKITIFNKSFTAQRLVATTRFKSPAGLIFRIPQTITVPSAVKTGSEIIPGSIESTVYADRPGAEYNIEPTQFTIPGFEGTPKFNDFYAVSKEPMIGGIIGPAKVVTEEDFAKAQETLAAKIKEEIYRSLKDQAGELKILDTVAVKLEAPVSNAKVGTAADNFQMSVKGSADVIAFRESDVIELVKSFVSEKDNLELLTKDLNIGYINPVLNTDNNSLSFDVQVNGWAAARLDKDAIQKDLAGMGGGAVRSYIQGIKEIESARVILSPFWVRSVPKDLRKIKIDLAK
jgi:hypothetical protein